VVGTDNLVAFLEVTDELDVVFLETGLCRFFFF
jgi:hypothetical protein